MKALKVILALLVVSVMLLSACAAAPPLNRANSSGLRKRLRLRKK